MQFTVGTKARAVAVIQGWSFSSSAILYRMDPPFPFVRQVGLPGADVVMDVGGDANLTEAELLALRPNAVRGVDGVPIFN